MNDIVYITDQGYFMPTLVSIQSLSKSVKGPQVYHVYCLCDELPEEQKQMLKAQETSFVQIILLDCNEVSTRRSLNALKKHYYCSATPIALLKFDLADIFSDKDRILYLDGDTIIKGSIDPVFAVDLQDSYAAVVLDSRSLIEAEFFNSGVMLLNLAKIRGEGLSDVLYKEKFASADTSLMDQNTFNEVFNGKITLLPIKYNYVQASVFRLKYFRGVTLEKVNETYNTAYQTWDAIWDDACIIHFATKDKPWRFEDTFGADLWDHFYSITPLSVRQLKRKKVNYPFFFKLAECRAFRMFAILLWDCRVLGTYRALRHALKKFLKSIHRLLTGHKS